MFEPRYVGRCIYCRSARDLTREHVVPFGLEGDLLLQDASCRACAKVTGSIEGYCLGRFLGPFRTAMNFRSRKKKARSIPRVKITKKDGQEETIDVKTGEFPPALFMPVFPAARSLIGGPAPERDEPVLVNSLWTWHSPKHTLPFGQSQGIASIDFALVDNLQFARMVAKIGYATAVYELGLDGFIPTIVDFIMGRQDGANFYVGSRGTDDSKPDENALHKLTIRVNNDHGTVISLVRLFAFLGPPSYHVVVGFMPDHLRREVPSG